MYTGHGEQDDTYEPEEATKHQVQEAKGETQGQRQEPVGQEDHTNQHQGPGGTVGHGGWAEVL